MSASRHLRMTTMVRPSALLSQPRDRIRCSDRRCDTACARSRPCRCRLLTCSSLEGCPKFQKQHCNKRRSDDDDAMLILLKIRGEKTVIDNPVTDEGAPPLSVAWGSWSPFMDWCVSCLSPKTSQSVPGLSKFPKSTLQKRRSASA